MPHCALSSTGRYGGAATRPLPGDAIGNGAQRIADLIIKRNCSTKLAHFGSAITASGSALVIVGLRHLRLRHSQSGFPISASANARAFRMTVSTYSKLPHMSLLDDANSAVRLTEAAVNVGPTCKCQCCPI